MQIFLVFFRLAKNLYIFTKANINHIKIMDYNEYLKNNPEFAKKMNQENAKSYSSLTMLKFLFFSIVTGFAAMIFGAVGFSMGAAASGFNVTSVLLGGGASLFFAILSIAYLIALGVYIGVNSK